MSNPVCPECDSNSVALVKTFKRPLAVGGGVIGGVTAYKKTSSLVSVVASATPAGFLSTLGGIISGVLIGSEVGKRIDEEVISRYRCNSCEAEFEV